MAHSDKVEHPSSNTVEDLLPGFNNERVNIDEVENSTRCLISTCLQWRMGWGGKGGPSLGFHGEGAFLNIQNPAILRLKSQKKIHLTLKQQELHLFVKDVRCCLKDDANSSKPTCSLTRGVSAFGFSVFGNRRTDWWLDHEGSNREVRSAFIRTFHVIRQNIICWVGCLKCERL